MAHCKYHPLDGATYYCPRCDIHTCDVCTDESNNLRGNRCFVCSKEVESLGHSNLVEPFWRRLQEIFRYPIEKNALSFILIASILSTLLSVLPGFGLLTFVAYLFITGTIFKYALSCLMNTAEGEMTPPDMGDAFSGGLALMLKLFGLLIVLAIGMGALAHYIPALAGFFGVLLVICLPAMLIRFAQNERILEAANPLAAIQLILAIGLPYGLMLGFIIIMIGSMGILYELVGAHFGIVSVAMQSVIGNYYLLVIFHLAGYMLFQYQDQLGYSARIRLDREPRSAEDNLLARAIVCLKEGELNKMVEAFNEGFVKYPHDTRFGERYLEFLYKTKHARLMGDFADRYLKRNTQNQVSDTVDSAYIKIKHVCPDYTPKSSSVRHQIAIRCHHKGDNKTAIHLLNGLHKNDIDYPKLTDAYTLLIDCLNPIANTESKITAIEKFIASLEQKKASKKSADQAAVKARPPKRTNEAKTDELPPIGFR